MENNPLARTLDTFKRHELISGPAYLELSERVVRGEITTNKELVDLLTKLHFEGRPEDVQEIIKLRDTKENYYYVVPRVFVDVELPQKYSDLIVNFYEQGVINKKSKNKLLKSLKTPSSLIDVRVQEGTFHYFYLKSISEVIN
ncbi:hypothetical protein [Sabulibacter ruber]|uniref:hypothetical protein n=1 Tax=Sabulibacter ruber TaxID=2811901 RepID=UPI001A96D333|nr:hypothetical protein [Sabulibacter ruber]